MIHIKLKKIKTRLDYRILSMTNYFFSSANKVSGREKKIINYCKDETFNFISISNLF